MSYEAMIGAAWVTQTIVLAGVIAGLLVALSGLGVFLYGARWKSAWQVASAQANELRRALEDEQGRATRAEARERETLLTLAEVRADLAALPDLRVVLEHLDKHDIRAQERHAETVLVLQALANTISGTARA